VKPPSNTNDAVVLVVDDDSSMREALDSLIRSVGLRVVTFPSARSFFDSHGPRRRVSGARRAFAGPERPRSPAGDRRGGKDNSDYFITGHGDIPMSVRAMKAGAVEFLTKPFRDQDLLDAIQQAIERDRVALKARVEVDELRAALRVADASRA